VERDRGKADPCASGCTRAQPEGRDDTQLSFFDGSRERASQPLSGWSCRTRKTPAGCFCRRLVAGKPVHLFAPSDLDTEPNVITNFHGFSALAFPQGTNAARDSNGNFYDMSNDMRVF